MSETLDLHLKRLSLLPSTQKTYKAILQGAPSDGGELLRWANRRAHDEVPMGTVLPMRAAVKHYLVSLGYDPVELKALLPRATGPGAQMRRPLSPRQLALYHEAVKQLDQEPAHAILTLLPVTGLRISEVCELQVSDVQPEVLRIRGKRGQERFLPLNRVGQQALGAYLEARSPAKWLFEGYTGRPIGPHAVRKHTRKIAEDWPELQGLCPQVLRATAAAMWLERGMDLRTLQAVLGHVNMSTTERYLRR